MTKGDWLPFGYFTRHLRETSPRDFQGNLQNFPRDLDTTDYENPSDSGRQMGGLALQDGQKPGQVPLPAPGQVPLPGWQLSLLTPGQLSLPGWQVPLLVPGQVDTALMKKAELALAAPSTYGREKTAVDVVPGGGMSRLMSLTLGRLNPLSLKNLILSLRAYNRADKEDRPKKHEELAKAMESARPEELKDTVLRLEGTDLVDDLLWKKVRDGEKLPWTSRIGGRTWQNPRTSLFGKALGTAVYPVVTLMNLFRASHYNPFSDAAVVYGDVPAATTHELGHAIDFNSVSGKRPGFFRRLGRDAYTLLYPIMPLGLWHEGMANFRSRLALERALKDKPDLLHQIMVERDKVLPAGYGSYIADLPGMIGGKLVGLGMAAIRNADRSVGSSVAAPAPHVDLPVAKSDAPILQSETEKDKKKKNNDTEKIAKTKKAAKVKKANLTPAGSRKPNLVKAAGRLLALMS